jgi:plastocyanin
MTVRPGISLLSALLVTAAAGGLAGCFSEHVQAPPAGQCVAAPDSTPQGSPIIHIIDFAFQAASTCVAVGTTVTWQNDDTQAHTSTADQGEWDSPLLSPGNSFTFTFNQPGTFAFHCTPHPFMQGGVVVQ